MLPNKLSNVKLSLSDGDCCKTEIRVLQFMSEKKVSSNSEEI